MLLTGVTDIQVGTKLSQMLLCEGTNSGVNGEISVQLAVFSRGTFTQPHSVGLGLSTRNAPTPGLSLPMESLG